MTRAEIEFFYKPEKPVPLNKLSIVVGERNFSEQVTAKDQELINNIWTENVLKKSPTSFSKARGLATLYNASGANLTYQGAEFKEYAAVSTTSKERSLNERLYENMRISAVGATLELEDGSIFVHRRSYQATHVAGVIDSSCAGLCFVKNNNALDVEADLLKKCEKELGIKREEIEILGVTGIHSAYAPDFSGLIDISLKTNLTQQDLLERTKNQDFPDHWFVKKKYLSDFVYKHFIEEEDMVGDGASVLLSCLDYPTFRESIERLQKAGKEIKFGSLKEGRFI